MRTKIGGALALQQAPNGSLAAQTGLSGPIVHIGMDLKVAGLTARAHIVTQTAAARGQRVGQGVADGLRQTLIARQGNPVRGRSGVDARPEQAFRGIDVADAHHDVPGQQRLLDRQGPASGAFVQPTPVKTRVKRLNTQFEQERMLKQRSALVGMPQHRSKASWVMQAQCAAREHPIHVIMLARRFVGVDVPDRTRHAKVNDHGAVFEVQPQVFAAPSGVEHLPPVDQCGQVFGDGPSELMVTDQELPQHLTFNGRGDAAASGFDFR